MGCKGGGGWGGVYVFCTNFDGIWNFWHPLYTDANMPTQSQAHKEACVSRIHRVTNVHTHPHLMGMFLRLRLCKDVNSTT